MNKDARKTKPTQQTKPEEQGPNAAPAPSEPTTQPTKAEELTTETSPTGADKPPERQYTRNVEETIISLMLHDSRLFSGLSTYFKPQLFVMKADSQLWSLISRGKVEEFALQEAINRAKLDEPEKQDLRSLLARVFRSPQPTIHEDAFRRVKDWLVRATWDDLISEPFQAVGPVIERLSAVSLTATGRSPILDLQKPNWPDVTEEILSAEVCVPFAFPEHNESGGLPKGSVAVFAGFSHCGKSKLAFYMSLVAALKGLSVLIIDFENNQRSSRRNLIACLTHRPWRDVANLPEAERAKLLTTIDKLPLELINPVGSGDATRAGIRRLLIDYRNRNKKFPDLLVIDQLGKIETGQKNASLHEKGEARIMAVQEIAKQHDIAIMLPHHINRQGQQESAKGKSVNELSIAGSQKIFDWADFVFIMDAPFDDRDVDDPVIRDFIYVKLRNRKARDERRLQTLYFQIDPARYIFKPITREEYIEAESKITGTTDRNSEPKEAKLNQTQRKGSAGLYADLTRGETRTTRRSSAGIVLTED